jgi:hypothetical protein
MRAKSLIPAIVCLLSTTACALSSPARPTPGFNEAFTLAPGEMARIEATPLRLQFLHVSGDSRCPADAICIQGGDAMVHLRVRSGLSDDEYRLHTGDASRGTVQHQEVKIQLLDLQPYPFSSRTIQPHEYRATLLVYR